MEASLVYQQDIVDITKKLNGKNKKILFFAPKNLSDGNEKILCSLSLEQQLPGEEEYNISSFNLNQLMVGNEFYNGNDTGIEDALNYRRRLYFNDAKEVTWLFLVGYELGFLLGLQVSRLPLELQESFKIEYK